MMHPHKVGMALGGTAGALHIIWSLIVALGWGQALVDFSTGLHFMSTTMVVLPFDFMTAIEVVVIASLIGFGVGNIFATIWNAVNR